MAKSLVKYPRPIKFKTLKPEELRWKCDEDVFDFDSTSDLEPIEGIIGQERALKAIKLGVDLRSPGYNIYIAGLSGTGKATTVKSMLEKISGNCPSLYDYAYVNNFKDEDMPLLLVFETGMAKEFQHDLNSAIELLKKKIPVALETDAYSKKKKIIINQYSEKEQELLNSFNQRLEKENFSLGHIKIGDTAQPEVFPVIKGKSVPIQMIDEKVQEKVISKEQASDIVKKYTNHKEELQKIFRKGLKISQDFQDKLVSLEREYVESVVNGVVLNLKEKYTNEKVIEYLDQVEENILDNIHVFKGLKPEGATTAEGFIIDYFRAYDVNIILDNSGLKRCPVIIETNPTHTNIFGSVEKISDGRGGWYTDFTKIKCGSLLRANGGYLVLNVNHLFEEPTVWRTLKRVLTYRKHEIQDPGSYYQFTASTLKPEPIDIDTKVIMIGSQQIYSMLANYEYDFKKIFKVKADFDYEIKRNSVVLVQYARVIKKLIKEESLCEFDKGAIASLIELSARFAGQKDKLTTRFSQIADVAREANFWALDDGFNIVSAPHIQKAYALAKERHGLLESKVNNMIEEQSVLIDTHGDRIGQINGLAVYDAEFYAFGRPTRITATVSLGNGSIINVERESGMSGKSYNKGMLIITGYFKETFGQTMPLSFNANIVFEQSYSMVDGDSASCAEIFTLLSTLADLPLKQSLAVTGSLNQKGDVQPIGGVNEKIEGFYDVCKFQGLNKKQGVVIPIQNVKDLMLREDIVESVKKGEFNIYPIERVEQGIEILTGVKAGKRINNKYETNSVFNLVEKKIKELYQKGKAASKPLKKRAVKKPVTKKPATKGK
ncbi:MAG: AAA family ATPase [Ignavibacteriaceae bacterium]|nr:AAA family ATPase [Ignavibacteriaceae bacterium]